MLPPQIRFVTRLIFGLALTLLYLSHAHAQTVITFVSAPGAATWKNDSGSGTVSLAYDGSGPPAIDGASTITWQQGAGAPLGVTTYTATYSGNFVAGVTGSIQVQCDDLCTVSLNGVQLGATTQDQWNAIATFAIPANVYVNGTNTLSIAVTNTAGYTGVAFLATAIAPTPAPAPAPPSPPALAACTAASTSTCSLPPAAVKIGDDGTVVTIRLVAAPVELLYCSGTTCNPPVMFGQTNPIFVGPNGLFGALPTYVSGSASTPSATPVSGFTSTPAATAPGSLYILPGVREVTLITAAPSAPITIPAAAPQ